MELLEYKGKIYNCEYCSYSTINGKSYRTHRSFCKRKYEGKPRYNVRRVYKNRKSPATPEGKEYKCICGKVFINKQAYSAHCGQCLTRHPELKFSKRGLFEWNNEHKSWNKGKTKDTCESLRRQGEKLSKGWAEGKYKHSNPRDLEKWKSNISKSMKKALAEGRHCWVYHCKGIQTYPEKYFTDLIKNNIIDKNYIPEYQVKHFRIDFMWPFKRKGIEIDGRYHDTNQEYDLKRDTIIYNSGYQILRIKWSYLKKNPKEVIELVNNYLK